MKLYIVVRADLPAGPQIAQSCHAMRLFAAENPVIEAHWYGDSNNLVCLKVPSEAALLEHAQEIQADGCPVALFREPDYRNEATAFAAAPEAARKLANLPLAG